MAINPLLAMGVISCTLSGPGHAQSSHKKAIDLLERSMQTKFSVNVVGIISQRDPQHGSRQRIKIERDKTGKTRKSVLYPLRSQGMESVDDGDRYMFYDPDAKVLLDHESPLKLKGDIEYRLALAAKNYKFSVDSKSRVAGRTAWKIVATPKSEDMDTRRFYVDTTTYFPLKTETVSSEGEVVVQFEVQDIKYPESIDPEVFQMRCPEGTNHIRYQRPTSLTNASKAKEMVGFAPIVPTKLPCGFQTQDMQINQNSQWKSLILRLTDGLARATVYEYRRNDPDTVATMDGESRRDVGAIRLMIISDLGPTVREKLLQSFPNYCQVNPPLPTTYMGSWSQGNCVSTKREPRAWTTAFAYLESDKFVSLKVKDNYLARAGKTPYPRAQAN